MDQESRNTGKEAEMSEYAEARKNLRKSADSFSAYLFPNSFLWLSR
jgi:hypothetical protein